MNITVRYFGPAREATGINEEELQMNEGARLSDVRSTLLDRYPGLAGLGSASRFALNMEYVSDNELLTEGAEVAMIPPVAGG